MKKSIILTAIFTMVAAVGFADNDYDDDIYYNPKAQKTVKSKTQSNYIADRANMDVDAYNRRGQYYESPVDTIGMSTGNGEDFVYTRQIQKYYNPTIVVDNSAVLADVLNNSYGNIDIVINNGYPTLLPVYSSWPYYNYTWTPGFNIGWGWGGWGWNLSWNTGWYDPWFAWNSPWVSPWYPSWRPGWYPPGPSWGYYPPGPGWRPKPVYHANYRPAGNRPAGAIGGWSNSTRPGYNSNYNGNVISGRNPNISSRPSQSTTSRPATNVTNNSGVSQRGERGDGSTNYRRPAVSGSVTTSPVNNGRVQSTSRVPTTTVNTSRNNSTNLNTGTTNRTPTNRVESSGSSYNSNHNNRGTSYNQSSSRSTGNYSGNRGGSYSSGSRGTTGGMSGGARGRHR